MSSEWFAHCPKCGDLLMVSYGKSYVCKCGINWDHANVARLQQAEATIKNLLREAERE